MKPKPETDRFQYERALLEQGITSVAGVDEAGRGPLAGPVVAAAVVLPSDWFSGDILPDLTGLNDSKQLTAAQREAFFHVLISRTEIQYAIATVPAEVIDRINILQATHLAMNQALSQLSPPPRHVLVDGLRVRSMILPQTPIVKGDAKSYSIAAASILAKVTRDRQMEEFHRQFPVYGFASHKGYGTIEHLAALQLHGPCPIHRRSFAPLKLHQVELF